MSYYSYPAYASGDDIDNVDFNKESMLGHIPNPVTNNSEVNLELDQELNEWLKEIVDEELVPDNIDEDLKDTDAANDSLDPVKEQFQDYYDDFPEQKQESIPPWYEEMLQNKIKETKKRLAKLSDYVCYASAATRQQIIRIERDHNSPFCKLDFPRHPPLSEPWQNYWRFNCVRKCSEDPDPPPYHAHTAQCEIILLEHVGTGVTTRSKNILSCEFPEYVMHTVEQFQNFAMESSKVNLDDDTIPDTVFEKPNWQYIKIRSNFKGEIMLIACGKGISPALKGLKEFFSNGPGRVCNVVSLYCINIKWSQKKSVFPPTFLTGCLELRDKVGPITIYYNPKTNMNFNSVEVIQLGKVMLEYLEPTLDTTAIDIGCNIGALSLMLAQKSDKVVGLSTLDHEIKAAEQMKNHNNLHNVSFILCSQREVQTKLAPLVKKCIAVAAVNLNSPYGKIKECSEVMTALRELPTVWRIAVYGSFSFDNRKCIEKLTSAANDSEFLPMRGCILDKSPSVQNLFDVVILFERKSLIEPKIELIATGPTVNVTSETFENKSVKQEFNPTKFSDTKPFLKGGRPSRKFGRFDSPMLPIERDIKPKLPPPPKEILDFTAPPPPLPPSAKPSHSLIEKKGKDKEHHRPSVIDMLNVKALKRKFDSPYLPISPPRTTSSSLNNEKINVNGSEQSTNLANKNSDQIIDTPVLPNASARPLNHLSWHQPAEVQPETPQQIIQSVSSAGSGVLRIKQEHELKFSSQLEYSKEPVNPTLQYQNNQYNSSSLPLNEKEGETSETIEQKPVFKERSSPIEREEGELSDSDSICLDAIIKPEPMDLDDDDSESDFSSTTALQGKQEITENNAAPSAIHIKTEPIDFNEFSIKPEPHDIMDDCESISSADSNRLSIKPEPDSTNFSRSCISPKAETNLFSQPHLTGLRVKPELASASFPVNIKSEPIEDDIQTAEVSENTLSTGVTVKNEISSPQPNIDDIENMETPVHNPAALNRQYTPSPPPSASTFDGFEFAVKPNMSFLNFSKEADKKLVGTVKRETVESENNQNVRNQDNDEEIKIIGVKGQIVEEQFKKNIKLERPVKSEHSSEKYDDLQMLLEQREKLQKQLESSEGSEKLKRRRSPSSSRRSLSRDRHSPGSLSRWRPKPQYSPDRTRRRRNRSPVSPSWSRGNRSPSFDRNRGKRWRSPISPNRKPYKRNKSPSSPDRFYRNRYSPDSPVYKKRNQSPDIYERLYGRKKRSSESPDKTRNKRNRSPESPGRSRPRKNRTPDSTDKPWLKRNKTPPSFERNWRYRNRSPPGFENNLNWDRKRRSRSSNRKYSKSRSRSSSLSERRRKRSPASPSSLLSQSPPVKYLRANKSPVNERATKSPSPALSTSSKTSYEKKDSDSKKKKKKKKKKKSSKSRSPHRSESDKNEIKKSKSSKSVKLFSNLQIEAVSSEDSPKNLEKQSAVELPNENPLPTSVV